MSAVDGTTGATRRGRLELVSWAARLGAITAEALAISFDVSTAAARARLNGAVHARLLERVKPLAGEPALYVVTAAGMRASGERELARCTVSASGASHLIACARVAAELERASPDTILLGERELRREERRSGGALASATLGDGAEARLHRPDLVLIPRPDNDDIDTWASASTRERGTDTIEDERERRPLAVEVELTVKAPRRLEEILSAWGRCELVAGVLYVCSAEVARTLPTILRRVDAGGRIALLEACGTELLDAIEE